MKNQYIDEKKLQKMLLIISAVIKNFAKKMKKSLVEQKKFVPLHSQMRQGTHTLRGIARDI